MKAKRPIDYFHARPRALSDSEVTQTSPRLP